MRKIQRRFILALCPILIAIPLTIVLRRFQVQRHVQASRSLVRAIQSGSTADAVKCLRLGADPNGRDHEGSPLIFSATNDPVLLDALLKAGANPDARRIAVYQEPYVEGETPLMEWGRYGDEYNYKKVQLLLKYGADPNARQNGQAGLDTLSLSAGGCGEACWVNPKTVLLLLKYGAHLNDLNATSTLRTAIQAHPDDSTLIHVWLTLPIEKKVRNSALKTAIHDLEKNRYGADIDISRIKAIEFLKRQIKTK